MSVEAIEHELARLRLNENGTLGLRASVLNLIVVTDEESAGDVTRTISELSGRYPSRTVLMISDPKEAETNLDVGLSAFWLERGGGDRQVCAEQIKIHVEGPPAEHLESLAGPLLIPDLPIFLWYPNGAIPSFPEGEGIASLADRIILDSGVADDYEPSLRAVGNLLDRGVPAIGDLQWAALSPWRSLVANLFAPPERARELEKIRRVEILHHRGGECRSLFFAGWLSAALSWRLQSAARTERGRAFQFASSSGEVNVDLIQTAPEATLHQVRIFTEELSLQVRLSHHGGHADLCSIMMRGDELVSERAVHLESSGLGVLLAEELKFLGRDEAYEAALRRAVEMLDG